MANLAPVTIGKQEDVAKLDELEEQMQGLVKRAKSFDVRDDDSRDSAVDYLKSLKAVYRVIEAITERFRAPAWNYYKSVQAEKKGILDPADKAIEIVKGKIAAYRKEVEEVAAALLQEELEKRYTEEIQEAEEEYRTATREGRTEDALRAVEEMRRQPTIADPTGVAISAGLITENEGISYREYWYADLESPGSLMDLVKAVAAGDAPLEFLAIDTKVVGEWVRRQKSAFNYPGLKSWCEKGVAVN